MVRLQLGYDLRRAPMCPATHSQLYQAVLDQCQWADERGFEYVQMGEHHAAEDGYLSNPITLAAAIAARTRRLFIRPVVLVPLYDPVRLAEELMTVDLLSEGRLHPLLAAGYRRAEFEMFGKDRARRGVSLTETVELLRMAWTGEEFVYQGRRVRVTPCPHRPGGPLLVLGGSSEVAARRAARIGDRFLAGEPGHWVTYVDECARIGRDPGPRDGGGPGFIHVTRDPDRAWNQVAPYLMHNAAVYEEWTRADLGRVSSPFPPVRTLDDLKAIPSYKVVTPEECIELALEYERKDRAIVFLPLLGGIPPDVAWESLSLFEDEVLPYLRVERQDGSSA